MDDFTKNDPAFLVHVPITLDLVEEHLQRQCISFSRDDGLLRAGWDDFVLTCRVFEPSILGLRAELRLSLPVDQYLAAVGRCNQWNAERIGPKASAKVVLAAQEAGGERTPVVITQLEHEVSFRAGLNRLQLHECVWFFLTSITTFLEWQRKPSHLVPDDAPPPP